MRMFIGNKKIQSSPRLLILATCILAFYGCAVINEKLSLFLDHPVSESQRERTNNMES